MADEKEKTPAAPKTAAAPKPARAAGTKPAAAAPAATKAAKPAAAPKAAAKPAAASRAEAPADPNAPRCTMAGCKRPVRAKGYCRKHYIGWRRGDVGKKHRYKTCAREGCRKRREIGGLCGEHAGKGGGEAAAAG